MYNILQYYAFASLWQQVAICLHFAFSPGRKGSKDKERDLWGFPTPSRSGFYTLDIERETHTHTQLLKQAGGNAQPSSERKASKLHQLVRSKYRTRPSPICKTSTDSFSFYQSGQNWWTGHVEQLPSQAHLSWSST